MKIVHTIPYLNIESGGPPIVVKSMTENQALSGNEAVVVAQKTANGTLIDIAGVELKLFDTDLSLYGFKYSSGLSRTLFKYVRTADIIHSHGLWTYIHFLSYKSSQRYEVPHIITVNGMLEEAALNVNRLKKGFVKRLFQYRAVETAACLHAFNNEEFDNIRQHGFKTPIAVIPNGVYLPEGEHPRDIAEKAFPALGGKRWILFHSRIHPIKGIMNLVRAWSEIKGQYPDYHLVISGPDENSHWKEIKKVLDTDCGEASYTYTGMVQGLISHSLLSNAEVFVLPSYSEGFSMAILESLAHKTPVIISNNCKFDQIDEIGAGIVTENNPDSLKVALREFFTIDSRERQEMGIKGWDYVNENHNWATITKKLTYTYNWLLNQASCPEWVRLS